MPYLGNKKLHKMNLKKPKFIKETNQKIKKLIDSDNLLNMNNTRNSFTRKINKITQNPNIQSINKRTKDLVRKIIFKIEIEQKRINPSAWLGKLQDNLEQQ